MECVFPLSRKGRRGAAGNTEGLTLVSYTAPGAAFVAADAYKQKILTRRPAHSAQAHIR